MDPRDATSKQRGALRALVVVGCSAGGLTVCRTLLAGLRPSDPLAVVIVQHRAPRPSQLVEVLASSTTLPVAEPDDKAPLRCGEVLVAPPGYHLLVEPGHIELSTEEPVAFNRPSIDLTFSSAAAAYADKVIAVVLTGANADGAEGAREVVRRGGRLVVQDPATAVAREMPTAALATGLPASVATPDELGPLVRALALGTRRQGGAA